MDAEERNHRLEQLGAAIGVVVVVAVALFVLYALFRLAVLL